MPRTKVRSLFQAAARECVRSTRTPSTNAVEPGAGATSTSAAAAAAAADISTTRGEASSTTASSTDESSLTRRLDSTQFCCKDSVSVDGRRNSGFITKKAQSQQVSRWKKKKFSQTKFVSPANHFSSSHQVFGTFLMNTSEKKTVVNISKLCHKENWLVLFNRWLVSVHFGFVFLSCVRFPLSYTSTLLPLSFFYYVSRPILFTTSYMYNVVWLGLMAGWIKFHPFFIDSLVRLPQFVRVPASVVDRTQKRSDALTNCAIFFFFSLFRSLSLSPSLRSSSPFARFQSNFKLDVFTKNAISKFILINILGDRNNKKNFFFAGP